MNTFITKTVIFLLSFLLNLAFLNVKISSFNHSVPSKSNDHKVIIKLVETKAYPDQEIKKIRNQPIIPKSQKLTLSMLEVNRSKTIILSKELSLDNNTSNTSYKIGSGVIEVFSKIDERLNYPRELMIHNQQGIVNVRIFFDQKGNYQEKNSKFETNNNYLKVHVARILRAALKSPRKPNQYTQGSVYTAKATFYFHLSTGLDPEGENTVTSDKLSFYRHGYGGDTIYDKIHQNAPSLPNLLATLYKHRPKFLKSERTLVKEYLNGKIFEDYKNDPAWEL